MDLVYAGDKGLLPKIHRELFKLNYNKSNNLIKKWAGWGTQVAQSVKRLSVAQVMILRSMSSSPLLGSMLTAQGLEPASESVSPSLSAPPPLTLCFSLSQK